ncbi:MAG: hypothetical protein V3U96_12030 [Paracoccaceae bacterium]
MFFATASFAQWLIPGSLYDGEILPLKLSGTVVFFAVSALLYRIARRGMSEVVQIDTLRQKVTVLRRNRYGRSTRKVGLSFSDIGSVFIRRSKTDMVPSSMFMRHRTGGVAIHLVSGPARELEPLLDRIQADCREAVGQAAATTGRLPVKPSSAPAKGAFAAG